MTAVLVLSTLLCGFVIGVWVDRTGFCLFGAMAEWFGARATRRLPGILAAMLVFSAVWVVGYRGTPP